MQERIFTLKKGTEVPAAFDGVTIPFTVPGGLAEICRVGGLAESIVSQIATVESALDTIGLAARNNVVAIFNQAHALNVQKSVKVEAMEDGATIEGLRKHAADFKYGQVRVRGTSTGGSAKPSAAKVEAALGADFLALLTPEQRAMYDERIAALKVKPAAAPAAEAAPAAPATAPTAPAAQGGKKK